VIESDDPVVRELAARIAGDAQGREAVRRLFDWVRDEIRYEMSPEIAVREDWRATGTLERGYGFCQQKAVLLASLLRARGIPAGLVFQDLIDRKIPPSYVEFIGSQRLEAHGLTRAYLDGEWVLLDATLPRALVERKGYRLVELADDGDATLAATDEAGEPHFEVHAELGSWPDLPDEIVDLTLSFEWLHSEPYKRMARRHGPGM
jgi:transglutaminase-like putative cysteine protease